MSNTNNIMLDLETMGTSDNAAIIAIGAVRFDKEVVDRFYTVVDLKSSVTIGLEIEPDTVMWWLRQSQEARDKFKVEATTINRALIRFCNWVGEDALMWGNGAAFDNVILRNAYHKTGVQAPWMFYNDRCYRTIKNLYPDVAMNRSGVHHCAVDDAESQAQHLIHLLTHMK